MWDGREKGKTQNLSNHFSDSGTLTATGLTLGLKQLPVTPWIWGGKTSYPFAPLHLLGRAWLKAQVLLPGRLTLIFKHEFLFTLQHDL